MLGAALRRSHHAAHFAGAESALQWNGYLDGAVEAGESAALAAAATAAADAALSTVMAGLALERKFGGGGELDELRLRTSPPRQLLGECNPKKK